MTYCKPVTVFVYFLPVVFFVSIAILHSKKKYPTVDEIAHLPSGVSHWEFNNFDLYRVNPPLVRILAGLPAWIYGIDYDWRLFNAAVGKRPEFDIGIERLTRVKIALAEDFVFARLAVASLILAGMVWIFFLLSHPLVPASRAVVMLYWCFSPSCLELGSSIVPDLGAVVVGCILAISTSTYVKAPSRLSSLFSGFWMGIALLSKLTWLSALVTIPFSTLLCYCVIPNFRTARSVKKMFFDLFFFWLSALFVLNVGYLFESSCHSLGNLEFCSKMLGGEDATLNKPENRFESSILSSTPVVFPKNYILGIDYLKFEVEQKKWSFLDGEWRFGSWPYYYIMTTLYKTPEPTLIAAAMGIYIFVMGWWRGLAKPELVTMVLLLTIPAAVCFLSVSWQGGFNHHHRYVIMIYPPMFVFASLLASPLAEQVFSRKKLVAMVEDSHESEAANVSKALIPWWAVWRRYHWTKILAVVLVSLSVASTLRVHPYYTSYFNTLSGGPENGWRRLGFSNIDWGQDILEVDQWLKKYPERRPLVMDIDYFGMNGDLFDVPTSSPPQLPLGASVDEVRRSITETQWWIISVKKLYNLPDQPGLQYLQQIEPVERIAYAYHVYRIDPLPPEESSSPDEPTP